MIGGDQKIILLKANLSTGLYLHITIDNLSIMMIQRKIDFFFGNHRPTRDGDRYGQDHEKDSGDFKLKVDIPFFSGNLNIEGFT